MSQSQPFHLTLPSPWPLLLSVGMTGVVLSFSMSVYSVSMSSWVVSLVLVFMVASLWFRDITREATIQGDHTNVVVIGVRWGMGLFITSEVLLFFSLFWGYLHSALSVPVSIGSLWPLEGVIPLNAFELPMLNTAILLASGVCITLAHHSLILGNYHPSMLGLLITVVLGLYFIGIQTLEYQSCSYSLRDGTFGCSFFMATSAHGMHVLVGAGILSIMMLRLGMGHFVSDHHFGFEAGAWYWHFVDVVWLFLFLLMYWWGGYRYRSHMTPILYG